MKTRIITSVILVPLLLVVLFVAPKLMTAILFGVLSAFAAYELLYNTGLVRHWRLVAYSMAAAALVPLWCFYGMAALWLHIGILAFFCLLFMETMLSHVKLKFEKVSVCMAAGFLVPYLLSSLVRIIMPEGGRYVILIPFIIAFLSDTGAYFIGSRFGRHKLAPVISPNKSVEGFFGGIAFAVVSMLLYALVMDLAFADCQVHYGYALVYGVLGAVGGVFGDLCFSVIKRQTGIKDYGNLMPGHGGVLDRFDSMLVVAPLVEILLVLLPVVTVK